MRVTTVYQSATGLVGTAGVACIDPATAATILSRTTAVTEVGATGIYFWSGSLPDALDYLFVWDDGGSPADYAADVVSPQRLAIPAVVAGSAALTLTDFYWKRGDTEEPILAVAQLADGTIKNISDADVAFVLSKDPAGAALWKQAGSVVDGLSGIMSYQPVAGDTDPAGVVYDASTHTAILFGEFEVTYPDGNVETFPQRSYINVHLMDDLG